jgi:hypothetical protein
MFGSCIHASVFWSCVSLECVSIAPFSHCVHSSVCLPYGCVSVDRAPVSGPQDAWASAGGHLWHHQPPPLRHLRYVAFTMVKGLFTTRHLGRRIETYETAGIPAFVSLILLILIPLFPMIWCVSCQGCCSGSAASSCPREPTPSRRCTSISVTVI